MSPLSWEPKTEEEIQREQLGLFDEGVYPGLVIEAEERTDAKGRNFIEVKLELYDGDQSHHVYAHLSPHWFQHLFAHFFRSAGHEDMYQRGTLPSVDEVVGWNVLAEVGIQEKSVGKDGKEYPPKNVINDFVTKDVKDNYDMVKKAKAGAESATAEAKKDDDLPWLS